MNDLVHLRHLNEVSELISMLDLGFVNSFNTQQLLTTLFESGKWLDKPSWALLDARQIQRYLHSLLIVLCLFVHLAASESSAIKQSPKR